MIRIKKPSVTVANGKARLSADIVVDGVSAPLWFEVDEKYGRFLCGERSDAFVLGLLHYAMWYGHDIVSDAPMTSRLHEQLTEQFLPPFLKINNASRLALAERKGHAFNLHITTPVAPEVEHEKDGNAVGTGVSCGVDSLHVFAKHPDVTHGCIWNGHGVNFKETAEMRRAAWDNLVAQARRFTSDIGVELIVGDTNFDRGCLPELRWDGMVTNGNLFCAFCLQKLWSKYYIASLCDVNDFRMAQPMSSDPAHYEYYLFAFSSLSRISIRLDGAEYRRVEKVADLAAYAPARKFLNTCWGLHDGHRNCSYRCPKCMRTMLDLYCVDALEAFNSVYDVTYFKDHLAEYVAEYYRGCLQGDFFMRELTPYLRRKKIPLAIKSAAVKIVLKKALRKVLRRGAVSYQFSPN